VASTKKTVKTEPQETGSQETRPQETQVGDTKPVGAPELSYEDARAELIEVVRTLEAGGTTLEQSLALWERGEELATACQLLIDGARERLDSSRASASPT